LGERLLCKQEVIGSIPFTSTTSQRLVVPPTAVSQIPREGGWRHRGMACLRPAAIVTGVARHWRRFALTSVSAAIVEAVFACNAPAFAGLFFDRVKRV
jgi:hypothetical protein